jgi:hypothetical protein
VSWELDDEERRLILALPSQERYSYLVQLLVDTEEAWGLRDDDGWVVGSDPERGDILPLWPHSTFAQACAHGPRANARPAEIALDDLLEELLPLLIEDHITIAAFPASNGDCLLISPEQLARDLRAEIELGEGGEGETDLEDDSE